MPWFYDTETGIISEANPPPGIPLLSTDKGPFPTEAAAEAYKAAHPSGPRSLKNPLSAVTGPLTDVNKFLSALSTKNLWIRVGEVIVGLILMGIGLNSLLKGKPMSIVTGTAGVAGKAAML